MPFDLIAERGRVARLVYAHVLVSPRRRRTHLPRLTGMAMPSLGSRLRRRRLRCGVRSSSIPWATRSTTRENSSCSPGDSTISTPPSPSAGRSSLCTTPSTAMAESPCSPPMTCITAAPTPCCNNVNRPCAPPGVIILNASFAASRNPCRFPKRSGSTHLPNPQQERLLSKSQSPVSQSR